MSYSESWTNRIEPFAKAIDRTIDVVTDCLKSEVGDANDQALEALGNEEFTPFESLQVAFKPLNIPPAILRKNVSLLRVKAVEKAAPTNIVMTNVLPPIADDESFVKALKVGGELKVSTIEVIAAVKAAIADRVGLYDLPDVLKSKMEEVAEALEEPCSKEYFEMRNLVTKRNYADIMHALGIEGQFVSDARKTAFLKKLNELLWNETISFNTQLSNWNTTWINTASNPSMISSAILSAVSGNSQASPVASMMQPPDVAYLRDAAEALITTINKIFAGFGIPIARALAYEALEIKKVLEKSTLPALVGAPNKDVMLKMLNVSVAGDYVRLERNLVQYVVAVMEFPKVEPQTEILYLSSLYQLGMSIDWNKFAKTDNKFTKHRAY
jgi:hypothetical protein